MIAEVHAGISGVQVTRRQEEHEAEVYRVLPWYNTNTALEDLAKFLRGCLADAYHEGRNESLDMISRRDIAQIMFNTPACPDGEGGVACNYCKTDAVMAYLASVILTAH